MLPIQDTISDEQWEGYGRQLEMFMNSSESISKIHNMINNEKRRFAVDLDKLR